jgi:hypothetical protein
MKKQKSLIITKKKVQKSVPTENIIKNKIIEYLMKENGTFVEPENKNKKTRNFALIEKP